MARARRALRQTSTIWPGYVDALSTLLLVIIFLLVVFVLAQFFLNQLLQGKDTKLAEPGGRRSPADRAAQPRGGDHRRASPVGIAADLGSAGRAGGPGGCRVAARRDRDRARRVPRPAVRARGREGAAHPDPERAARGGGAQRRAARPSSSARPICAPGSRRSCSGRSRPSPPTRRRIEAQLAQLIQLRRDIEALQTTRNELELQVAEMAALLQAAEIAKGEATEEIARLADLLAAAAGADRGAREPGGRADRSVTEADRETQDLASEVTRLTQLLQSARDEKSAADERVAGIERRDREHARGARHPGQRGRAPRRAADLRPGRQRGPRAAGRRAVEPARGGADAAAERERRVAELAALLQEERRDRGATAATAEELQRAREQLLLELSQARDQATAAGGPARERAGAHHARAARARGARPADRGPAAQRRPHRGGARDRAGALARGPEPGRDPQPADQRAAGPARGARPGARARAAEGRGAAGHDHRSRQQAQHGARRQGRGAQPLPLGVLRPPAPAAGRPPRRADRGRPLRLPVRGAVPDRARPTSSPAARTSCASSPRACA